MTSELVKKNSRFPGLGVAPRLNEFIRAMSPPLDHFCSVAAEKSSDSHFKENRDTSKAETSVSASTSKSRIAALRGRKYRSAFNHRGNLSKTFAAGSL